MKHKYYDMIVAKAGNTDLFVFSNWPVYEGWRIIDGDGIGFHPEFEYFLCLPEHKEVCLHWLNGGDVEVTNESWDDWHDKDPLTVTPWSLGNYFMHSEFKFRIKPKKEKRWIVYCTETKRLGVKTFKTKEAAADHYFKEDNIQLIEIEVEEK